MRSRPEVMKRRQELVEHLCGTMQRGWEAGDFFMRGLEKVRAEFRVTVLTYNFRRVRKIVGMPGLMAALGGVFRVVGRPALADFQETILPDKRD